MPLPASLARLYELPWSGIPFQGPLLAFDTETDSRSDMGNSRHQRLVLMVVSDGLRTAVVRPDQIARLILTSPSSGSWVGHNVAFDYWTVYKTLEERREWTALSLWRNILTESRFKDTMLLDFLVRLADLSEVGVLRMMGLDKVSERWTGLSTTDKKSPYRLRFHEIMGREDDWPNPNKVDQRFFNYAVADVQDTARLGPILWTRAAKLSDAAGVQNSQLRHGRLTHDLQLKAAVVLQQVGVNGFALDRTKLDATRTRLRGEIDAEVEWLRARYPNLFDYYKRDTKGGHKIGDFKTTKGGIPSLKQGPLRTHLWEESQTEGLEWDALDKTPKTEELTTALDYWRDTLRDSPLVAHWSHFAALTKLHQFVVQINTDAEGKPSVAVHASYRPLVRTGRTSCTHPNIQQMPKEPWFRSMFVARPGHKLIVADYSAIELTTLAAVLYQRYGPRTLYRVLQEGRDPHAYTASLVLGEPYELVLAGVKSEKRAGVKGKYTHARQSAKAINFGVPGGLGVRRLAAYAKLSYGVDMTDEQAHELRDKLIYRVYPELAEYLSDDLPTRLAARLHTTRDMVVRAFNPKHEGFWRNIGLVLGQKSGKKVRKVGGGLKDFVWGTLAAISKNPDPVLDEQLWNWRGGELLRRQLTGETVVTLTGRVRSGADYGEARNTPFQGLAADGAKVALWHLYQAGFKIVAFVHDEIVTEVPSQGDNAQARAEMQVQLMQESMQSVLGCDLPVGVEYVVSDSWTK